MIQRLALILAILGPAMLGSGLLRYAHVEVCHDRSVTTDHRHAECGHACQPGGKSERPERRRPDPDRPGGERCAVCAMLASLTVEPPVLGSIGFVAHSERVVGLIEIETAWSSSDRETPRSTRGPPRIL